MPNSTIQTGGPLFEWVQTLRLWEDSKTFPDSLPLGSPQQIEQDFQNFLAEFAAAHPHLPVGSLENPTAFLGSTIAATLRQSFVDDFKAWVRPHFQTQPHSMEAHITAMWQVLERKSNELPAHSTLISLPNPYIVAGGRYLESYYWDSYFTSLGLVVSGRTETLHGMVENFSDLIQHLGYIPNGTRSYYLGRSQPPYFSHFLQLLEVTQGAAAAQVYDENLRQEYAFWMDRTAPGGAAPTPGRRSVALGGAVLNRYWDENTTPRPEGFWEDLQTASAAALGAEGTAKLYRHLRAAAESGWDFSSRWIAPTEAPGSAGAQFALHHIRTTDLLPIDLNSMLFQMETYLGHLAALGDDPVRAQQYAELAARRKSALLRLCWNNQAGWFFDYLLPKNAQTPVWSLAGLHPLYCKMLNANDPTEAAMLQQIRHNLVEHFLRPGGVVTTLNTTGQQWDAPNGWAPLQWVAAVGLLNYGFEAEAFTIADRFVSLARKTYAATGKMMEKYDVCDLARPGGGGEYPNQEGFGWTNGVVSAFLDLLTRGATSLAYRLATGI